MWEADRARRSSNSLSPMAPRTGARVSRGAAGQAHARDFIGDVALTPDGHLIYAADLYHDSVVVINPQSGMLIDRFKTGRRPYRILFHPDGKSFFVTSWTDGSVGHYDTNSGNQLATVRLGPHPTDIVWPAGKREDPEGEAS